QCCPEDHPSDEQLAAQPATTACASLTERRKPHVRSPAGRLLRQPRARVASPAGRLRRQPRGRLACPSQSPTPTAMSEPMTTVRLDAMLSSPNRQKVSKAHPPALQSAEP